MAASGFFMVLLGCASGGSACEPVTTLPMAYVSRSSCLMARGEIIAATGNLGFGSVRAECKASGARAIEAKITPDI